MIMAASGKLLTVRASDRSFALPVDGVIEIIRLPTINRVPHAPKSLIGVTNFRSTALAVVSLAQLLGADRTAHSGNTRIVVIEAGIRAGLLVDSVGTVSEELDHEVLDVRALFEREYSSTRRKAAGHKSSVDLGKTGAAPVEAEADARKAFISFEVAGQDYALALADVYAVVALPSGVTAVPRTDDAIFGVVEIARELVPLVSLRVLLGLPETGFDSAKSHVAVVRMAGKPVGLVVDSLKSVLRISARSIDDVPGVLSRGTGEAAIDAICRLDTGALVSILAVDRLFNPETTRLIADSGAHIGAEMANAEEAVALEQFVVFDLGGERYGLPVAAVDEIVRRPDQLTRVPLAPQFVDGIMSLRGKMIPVIDQRQRFAVDGQTDGRARRVIILTIDGLQTGITVDKVTEIVSVRQSELRAVPEMDKAGAVVDRVAIGQSHGDMILVIDPKALLDRAERDMLASMRSGQ